MDQKRMFVFVFSVLLPHSFNYGRVVFFCHLRSLLDCHPHLFAPSLQHVSSRGKQPDTQPSFHHLCHETSQCRRHITGLDAQKTVTTVPQRQLTIRSPQVRQTANLWHCMSCKWQIISPSMLIHLGLIWLLNTQRSQNRGYSSFQK